MTVARIDDDDDDEKWLGFDDRLHRRTTRHSLSAQRTQKHVPIHVENNCDKFGEGEELSSLGVILNCHGGIKITASYNATPCSLGDKQLRLW
jgi:hypothetical protein